MSVDALQAALKALRSEETLLDENAADVERELKLQKDRRERLDQLTAETSELAAKAQEARAYSEKAKAELADFPTDTQMLKLERRVESLKTSLKEAERTAEQLHTGIDAYKVRKNACVTSRASLTSSVAFHSTNMAEKLSARVERDGKLPTLAHVMQAVDALCSICEEREAELQDLQQQLATRTKEAAERTQRITDLRRRFEHDVPHLDAEREKAEMEINAAWQREVDFLQGTYERLYVVNKEQQYHLQRGTHIKRETQRMTDSQQQLSLSSQHSQIAADINEARSRVEEAHTEIVFLRRQANHLRDTCRLAHEQFGTSKDAAMEKLAKTRDAREATDEEAKVLRNLKSELHQVLQSIRDGTMTNGAHTPRLL